MSLVDEITLAEEADEDDVEVRFTEDGIQIEPFNLKAERSRGFFDAEGNYVAYRGDDDTDAWLETLPGVHGMDDIPHDIACTPALPVSHKSGASIVQASPCLVLAHSASDG